MDKTKLSLFTTGLVLAMFLMPMVASAAFTSSPSLTSCCVAFRAVNGHGVAQSGVKTTLEINDHLYVKYTNSLGMVTFNLSGYGPKTALQVDFEKGTLGANYLSTVGNTIGKSITIHLS